MSPPELDDRGGIGEPRGEDGVDDDEDVIVEIEGCRLMLDTGCLRRLSWDLRFASDLPDRFWQAASDAGWTDRTRVAGLREIENRDGDRVLVVLGTGRMQLRLAYRRPPETRQAAAVALARELAHVLTRART